MRHRHRPQFSEDSKKSGAIHAPLPNAGSTNRSTSVHASMSGFPPYMIDPSGCVPLIIADDLPYKAHIKS